jgi:hypothetical protein
MLDRRTLIQRITVAVGAGVVMASAPPAVARERTTHPTPPAGNVIDVVGTSTGFTMPERHSAGFVTFDVSTTHAQGGLFALWKLGPATTLGEALRYALMGLSDTRSESIQGGRALQQHADILGAAAVLPGQPVSFTSLLSPSTYYFVTYQDLREGGVSQAAQRLRRLSITSHYSAARPPVASATAVFTLAGRRAAYRMPTRLPGGRPLRMVNAMPQLTEAVFMPVRPDTTREQLRRFFAAADQEDWSVEPPFIGGPVGLPALSPNRTTLIEPALRPGLYALVTWYPDFNTGRMLAAEGQFELVTIT